MMKVEVEAAAAEEPLPLGPSMVTTLARTSNGADLHLNLVSYTDLMRNANFSFSLASVGCKVC